MPGSCYLSTVLYGPFFKVQFCSTLFNSNIKVIHFPMNNQHIELCVGAGHYSDKIVFKQNHHIIKMIKYANMSINIPKNYNVNQIIFIGQVPLQRADMTGITMATHLVVADVSLSANPY